MLGTESLYALNFGGTGISPWTILVIVPIFVFVPVFVFVLVLVSVLVLVLVIVPPGSGHPTNGDIFYCSGSRQLNHSSFANKFSKSHLHHHEVPE